MRPTLALLISCALALPAAAQAQSAAVSGAAVQAPGLRAGGTELTVRARVVELDAAGRTATLRGPRGDVVTVAVPPEVAIDRIRVADMLLIRYAMAVAVALEPTASRSGIRERVESQTAGTAQPGAAPAVAGRRTVEVLAVIQGIDRKARTATLRGVHRTVRVAVPEGIDMNRVKTGDEVRAVFTEAAVIAIEPAPRGGSGSGSGSGKAR
jgi:hypothetical protein